MLRVNWAGDEYCTDIDDVLKNWIRDLEAPPKNPLIYKFNLAGYDKKDVKLRHERNRIIVECGDKIINRPVDFDIYDIDTIKAKMSNGLLEVSIALLTKKQGDIKIE